jgi:hypothetical protein
MQDSVQAHAMRGLVGTRTGANIHADIFAREQEEDTAHKAALQQAQRRMDDLQVQQHALQEAINAGNIQQQRLTEGQEKSQQAQAQLDQETQAVLRQKQQVAESQAETTSDISRLESQIAAAEVLSELTCMQSCMCVLQDVTNPPFMRCRGNKMSTCRRVIKSCWTRTATWQHHRSNNKMRCSLRHGVTSVQPSSH